jgi:hypothetical protein
MPLPSVEEWEWLNWKFPRPVHAGDTIYARWTLTQKRPPVGGAPTSIVVWRVDLHTADGSLCAEGEVGAKVRRQVAVKERRPQEPAATQVAAGTAPRRRRGRRRPATAANGPVPEIPALATPPAATAKPERAAGPARRRRRRRPSGASSAPAGEPAGSSAPSTEPAPPPAPPSPAPSAAAERGGLSGVIRRLRRT